MNIYSDPTHLIEALIIFAVGACLGSFASALAWRVPQKIDWVKKRSSCTSCAHNLGFLDLIPVFSWLISRGSCRHCGEKVSAIYPILEVLSAVLCVGLYLKFGFTKELFFALLAFPFLAALFVIDIRLLILPNILVLVFGIIAAVKFIVDLFYAPHAQMLSIAIEHLSGAFLFAALPLLLSIIISKLLKKQSMGMGDVKLLFVIGLWLGGSALSYYFILSGLIACIYGGYMQIIMKKRIFPFGPALIAAFYILLALGGSFSV